MQATKPLESSTEPRGKARTLSPRQQEILRNVAEMRSNLEIARDLGISQRTVENHKATLCRRLGVRNSRELLVLAARHFNVQPLNRPVALAPAA